MVTVPTPVDPTVAHLLRSRPDEPDLIDAVSKIERLYPGLQIDMAHLKGAVTDLLVQQSSSADLQFLATAAPQRERTARKAIKLGLTRSDRSSVAFSLDATDNE